MHDCGDWKEVLPLLINIRDSTFTITTQEKGLGTITDS